MEDQQTKAPDEITGKQTKRIDFTKTSFEANGKTYFIESTIPVGRFMEFEIYQLELMFGMSLQKVYERLGVLRTMLNQTRFVDAAVALEDILRAAVKKSEKEPVVLKICALFINTADEDRTVFNNDTVVRKIEDWKAEGIDMRDFFTLAFNLVPTYIEVYNKLTRDITEALSPAGPSVA